MPRIATAIRVRSDTGPVDSTLSLDATLRRIAQHRPHIQPPADWHAATALVLCAEPEPKFIVIRRAERHGDPWSGHAALPGGRTDPADDDVVATARRETLEEVGIDAGAPVGRLDDIGGKLMRGIVSPVVFTLEAEVPLRPDPTEVAAAHWIPLTLLADPAARTRYPVKIVGPWPAWEYRTGAAAPFETLLIWGLTHQILLSFQRFRLPG